MKEYDGVICCKIVCGEVVSSGDPAKETKPVRPIPVKMGDGHMGPYGAVLPAFVYSITKCFKKKELDSYPFKCPFHFCKNKLSF